LDLITKQNNNLKSSILLTKTTIMKTFKFLSWFFLAALISLSACSKDKDDDDDDDNGTPINTADTIAQANLLAHFKFDGNVNDEKGHQTTQQGVTYTFDRHSQANSAYKGSETAYARIENPANLRVGSITMSMWLRAQQFPGGTNFIVTFIDPDSDWNAGYGLFQEGSMRGDTLRYKAFSKHQESDMFNWFDTDGGNYRRILFPSSKWFHLVYAYDGATSIRRIFLDGAKLGTDTIRAGNTPMGPITVPATAQYFYIGHNPNNAHEWIGNYKGDLDDLRIYNAALRDEQIQALFNAEKPQ
jgi:hypothetical protein